MTTTDCTTSVPCREVTDRHGRGYRVGERDVDLLGRSRIRMVVLSWTGMTGIGAATCAFASADASLGEAGPGRGGHVLWLLGVWVCGQAAVALPVGRLRESGRLPARTAMALGAAGVLLGQLAAVLVPQAGVAGAVAAGFGGTGAGVVWATCLHTAVKWCPERKGGGTGLVHGGFAWGCAPPLLLLALPLDPGVHRVALSVAGAALCLVVAAVGRSLQDPPRDWWPAHLDPLRVAADPRIRRVLEKNPPAVRQNTSKEAARAPALWLLWCCLLGAGGGTVLGLVRAVPLGRGMGLTGGALATAAAMTAVVAGTGSWLAGRFSDRKGRRGTLLALCLVLGAAQFGAVAALRAGSAPGLLVCSLVSAVCGAAVFPLCAAMTADCFGENDNAANYGLVHGSQLVTGLVCGVLGAAGGEVFSGAFVLAGSLGLASAAAALLLKAPGRPDARRIVPNPHPLGEEMA
ncbi:MFS transporter [Streptomyces sp. NPDC004561]